MDHSNKKSKSCEKSEIENKKLSLFPPKFLYLSIFSEN